MSDFEVHVSWNGETRQLGRVRVQRVRGRETLLFECGKRVERRVGVALPHLAGLPDGGIKHVRR